MQERKDLSRTESEKEERNGIRGRKPLHVSREVQKEKGEKQLKRRKKERYDYSFTGSKKKKRSRGALIIQSLYTDSEGERGGRFSLCFAYKTCVSSVALSDDFVFGSRGRAQGKKWLGVVLEALSSFTRNLSGPLAFCSTASLLRSSSRLPRELRGETPILCFLSFRLLWRMPYFLFFLH